MDWNSDLEDALKEKYLGLDHNQIASPQTPAHSRAHPDTSPPHPPEPGSSPFLMNDRDAGIMIENLLIKVRKLQEELGAVVQMTEYIDHWRRKRA